MTGKQIQDAVNEIIDGLKRDDFPNTCVNWGDLHCRAVSKITDMIDGGEIIQVLIEEADPIVNNRFERHIAAEFERKTGTEITVRCEW
jgi:hypothetical protein